MMIKDVVEIYMYMAKEKIYLQSLWFFMNSMRIWNMISYNMYTKDNKNTVLFGIKLLLTSCNIKNFFQQYLTDNVLMYFSELCSFSSSKYEKENYVLVVM